MISSQRRSFTLVVALVVMASISGACSKGSNFSNPTAPSDPVASPKVDLESIYTTDENGVVSVIPDGGGEVRYVTTLHLKIRASIPGILDEKLLVVPSVATDNSAPTAIRGYVKTTIIERGLFEIVYKVDGPPMGLAPGMTTKLYLAVVDNTGGQGGSSAAAKDYARSIKWISRD